MSDMLIERIEFAKHYCPYSENYCNGKHIPEINSSGIDKSFIRDKEPCEYFFEGHCTHKNNPINNAKKVGTIKFKRYGQTKKRLN